MTNEVSYSSYNLLIPFYSNESSHNSYFRADVDGFNWLCRSRTDHYYKHLTTGRTVKSLGFLDSELYPYTPNHFNGLSILFPFTLYCQRPDDFWSPAALLPHIRHVMLDNLRSGQVINIGGEDWMLFPYHTPGKVTRYGLETGNMGFAVRYVP